MGEAKVENQICQACGADARPGALFCYNCGSMVASAAKTDVGDEEKKLEKAESAGLNGNSKIENNSPKYVEAVDYPIGKPTEKLLPETAEKYVEAQDKKSSVQKQTKLKGAASPRQKNKNPEKRTVEVVWEEPDNSKNIWFIAVSLILVVFAVGVLLMMLYIR